MPRSNLCFMLAALVSAPGFIVATFAPGMLSGVVSLGRAAVWMGLVIGLLLAGLAFWNLDDE